MKRAATVAFALSVNCLFRNSRIAPPCEATRKKIAIDSVSQRQYLGTGTIDLEWIWGAFCALIFDEKDGANKLDDELSSGVC